jgi:hypothetical protein
MKAAKNTIDIANISVSKATMDNIDITGITLSRPSQTSQS